MSKLLIHGDYVMTYETLEKITHQSREEALQKLGVQSSWEESIGMAVIMFFHNDTIFQEVKRREKETA